MYCQEFVRRRHKNCCARLVRYVSIPIILFLTNNLLYHSVPTSWTREPGDTWVLEGTTQLVSCEADGFPHPTVILSRVTEGRRQEVSRGIKTASTNITIFSQDKEARNYLCEAFNEESRLEKEFKISIHGQSLFCWSIFDRISTKLLHFLFFREARTSRF